MPRPGQPGPPNFVTRDSSEIEICFQVCKSRAILIAPFGDAYEKIGTIQRRLAWPLHKDDTLFQSGRPTGLNIYFYLLITSFSFPLSFMLVPGEIAISISHMQ
ncbi:hypothetical protein BJV74DRAFT_977373 [Russula compacta]|nr:hypothetical protein BJV74DRAFT_977373 [Russula compacta]